MNSAVVHNAIRKVVARNAPILPDLNLVYFSPYKIHSRKNFSNGIVLKLFDKMLKERARRLHNGLCLIVGEDYRQELDVHCDLLSDKIAGHYISAVRDLNRLAGASGAALGIIGHGGADRVTIYHDNVLREIQASQMFVQKLIDEKVVYALKHVSKSRTVILNQAKNVVMNVAGIGGKVIVLITTGSVTFGVGSIPSALALFKNCVELCRSIAHLTMNVQTAVLRAIKGLEEMCAGINRDALGQRKPNVDILDKIATGAKIIISATAREMIGISPFVSFDEEEERIKIAKGKVSGLVTSAGFLMYELNETQKAYAECKQHHDIIANAMANVPIPAQKRLGTYQEMQDLMRQSDILQNDTARIASKLQACLSGFEQLGGQIDQVQQIFRMVKKDSKWDTVEGAATLLVKIAQTMGEVYLAATDASKVSQVVIAAAGVVKEKVQEYVDEKVESVLVKAVLGNDNLTKLRYRPLL